MSAGPGPALAAFQEALPGLLQGLPGHLTLREARFLALLGACPTAPGAVLEIGSFQGRSTVVLARAARLAGAAGVVAVDPLDSPSPTDPALEGRPSWEAEFRANLEAHGLTGDVEFHRVRSEVLARTWDRPLRLLWIDGDHTLAGARADLAMFAPFLAEGAVVALHDVLHPFEGPLRVFVEDILARGHARVAGVCGSIGWASWQRVPRPDPGPCATLARRLRPLLPLARPALTRWERLRFKLQRARVPHGDVAPDAWWAMAGRP